MRLEVRLTKQLLRAIMKAETPRGWTVHHRRGRDGKVEQPRREIWVPNAAYPYRCLWVFFHEVAHALRMREKTFKETHRGSSSFEELVAEEFAIEMLRRYGFPITAAELTDARANVRRWMRREKKLGLPVYEGVRRFAEGAKA